MGFFLRVERKRFCGGFWGGGGVAGGREGGNLPLEIEGKVVEVFT
jgi:hypothetical protein